MMNKLQAMKDRMEIRKAEKKGAVSIETIIVAGLLIALAVGIVIGFGSTVRDSATTSNSEIASAVNDMTKEMNDQRTDQTQGNVN